MNINNKRLSAPSESNLQTSQDNPLVESFGKEPRWVNWKLLKKGGRLTKVPYAITGRPASSTNPSTWSTYKKVLEKSKKVGIVFTSDKTLLGIDIDHCITDGVINHEDNGAIRKLIEKADTYTEISPSKAGLHLYLALSAPLDLERNRHSCFEAYTEGRYFTTTFQSFEKIRPVRTISPEEALSLLQIIGYPWQVTEAVGTSQNVLGPTKPIEIVDDVSLLAKMFSAKNGVAVRALHDGDISAYGQDDSRADFALLSHLAFWTGRDAAQMESIWLSSPLGKREKTQKRVDYRQGTIARAIAGCKEIYTPSTRLKETGDNSRSKNEKKSKKTLLEHIDGLENLTLFHDEKGEAYIALEVSGHQEIWPCNSKIIRKWLAHQNWKLHGEATSAEAIKSVIGALEGRAVFEGPVHKLDIRSAWQEGNLWYDLTDEEWKAVKINESGWNVVSYPPILFRRYSHSIPQVAPAVSGGNVSLFLKYVNIKDARQRLLLKVFLVSCFIPDFAHVILVIFGSQGSAKSTLSKLLRRVIDPSVIEVASMPEAPKELIQTLAHHAFLFFDNVSHISEITSDILCKAVTGSGFPKRELFSDDDDVIYTFKRCIGINGINLVGTRPDLLERSLLIELDRIADIDRKQEKELLNDFENDLPLILGGVLDALVKALQIKPSIRLNATPRMADFAVWGCAIAEALGHSKEEFIEAYQINIRKQTETVLNENVVAAAVTSFMESRDEWKGTATQLLSELNTHSYTEGIDTYEKYWPKASNALVRRLNELRVNLRDVGISFVSIPGDTREIILSKVTKEGADDTDDNF